MASRFFDRIVARRWRLGAIVWLMPTAMLAAQQPGRARTEALAARAGERLVALQREADRLASQESSLLTDLRKLEVDRQIKAEAMKRADAEAASVRAELDTTVAKMKTLQAAEAAVRPDLHARLVAMYKLGQARYVRLLLSARDLRRLGEASRTVAALAKIDRDRLAAHERTLDELRVTRATLEQRKGLAAAGRAAADKAQAAATRAAQAQADLIRDIDARRDLNAQVSAELQTAQQKLQAALRDLATGGSTAEVAPLPVRPFRGDLDWPIEPSKGEVRRRFGRTTGGPGSSSNGIELVADDGTTARAIHDGVVAFAGSFSGFGNLVILDHGSQAFSLYGDLLDIAVAKGARLDRGQAVGSAGPLPSGGTGLYFELRIDGKPVDPLQWLRKR
jgi:septal ring factor EnvC (AmiA/AmiB activator)